MSTRIASAFLVFALGALSGPPSAQRPSPPPAPTYYLAVEARTCEPDDVHIHGATNVPPRAVVELTVNDFNGDAWTEYSPLVYAAVDSRGFFDASVHPKSGLKFRHNLLVLATFAPTVDQQPQEVLRLVGRKGENLAGLLGDPQSKQWDGYREMLLVNPQAGQLSGWQYYLATIARVPNCGPATPPK